MNSTEKLSQRRIGWVAAMAAPLSVLALSGCGSSSGSAESQPSLAITPSAAATTEADFVKWLDELDTDGESVNENAGSGETGNNAIATDCKNWPQANQRQKQDIVNNLVKQAEASGITANPTWAESWLTTNCS